MSTIYNKGFGGEEKVLTSFSSTTKLEEKLGGEENSGLFKTEGNIGLSQNITKVSHRKSRW